MEEVKQIINLMAEAHKYGYSILAISKAPTQEELKISEVKLLMGIEVYDSKMHYEIARPKRLT